MDQSLIPIPKQTCCPRLQFTVLLVCFLTIVAGCRSTSSSRIRAHQHVAVPVSQAVSVTESNPETQLPELGATSLLNEKAEPQLAPPTSPYEVDPPPAPFSSSAESADTSPDAQLLIPFESANEGNQTFRSEVEYVEHLRELKAVVQLNKQGSPEVVDLSLSEVDDRQLSGIGLLTGLKNLDLTGTRITDAGLREVCKLATIESLKLKGTSITARGISLLDELPNLQLLDLSKTETNDECVVQLLKLESLKFLALNSTSVSDDCVPYLTRARTLKGLSIIDTRITAAGVRRLRADLPNCVVVDGAGARRLPEAMQMQVALSTNDPTAGQNAELKEDLFAKSSTDSSRSFLLMQELASRQPDLAIRLSETFSDRGEWKSAAAILAAASTTDPSNRELHLRLAEAIARSGDILAADQYLRATAGAATADYTMGVLRYEAMLRQCEKDFMKALSHDPTMIMAQQRLAEVRQELSTLHSSPQSDAVADASLRIVPNVKVPAATRLMLPPSGIDLPVSNEPRAANFREK
ncbi:MAG: hypothetical protein KDA91_10485 [Planctomycetaceae bacterium]|nr:hypothetical protein [Planctomycetaceae bacterium]